MGGRFGIIVDGTFEELPWLRSRQFNVLSAVFQDKLANPPKHLFRSGDAWQFPGNLRETNAAFWYTATRSGLSLGIPSSTVPSRGRNKSFSRRKSNCGKT